ncbi:MAG: MATE family efflux transporter [Erysipelotrichales bacterium]|nr:MATE family efflux transporter [Erysipelotrichales bacterium]
MSEFLKKIFLVEYMLPKEELEGEIPSSKEAYSRAFQMAWPSMTESVLTSIIGSVDMMMVGSLGTAAISSVGLTNQPRFMLLACIFALNAGVTAVVARRKGEGNVEAANRTLRQAVMVSFVISLILSSLGYMFAEELMYFAGAKADTIVNSTAYFKWLCVGMVFNAMSMTINAAQRGSGNTIISMTTNVTANIVNVIFNYLLIGGNFGFPALGVAGAAIASDIGFFVSFLMSVRSILNKNSFVNIRNKISWKFDAFTVKSVYKVTSAAFIEQIFFRIGFFLNARLVAELGTLAFATYQIGMQIVNLSFTFADGLSVAGSALVGQSLGRIRGDLAKIYGRVLQRMAFIISAVLFVVFIVFRRNIVMLFDSSVDVVAITSNIMIIAAIVTPLQTSQVVISGCLRGAGDTKFVAKTSMISTAIIRPLATFLLCFPLGLQEYGPWFAYLIDQSCRLTMNFGRFKDGSWSKLKL